MQRLILIAATLGLAALAGCGPGPNTNPVPPLRTEVIPKPPVSSEKLVWQPGYWNWDAASSSYAWVPGKYVSVNGHGPVWMLSYWQSSGAGWTFIPAHWTTPQAAGAPGS